PAAPTRRRAALRRTPLHPRQRAPPRARRAHPPAPDRRDAVRGRGALRQAVSASLARELRCIDCGASYPLAYRLECDTCRGLLELTYDLERLEAAGPALLTGTGLW